MSKLLKFLLAIQFVGIAYGEENVEVESAAPVMEAEMPAAASNYEPPVPAEGTFVFAETFATDFAGRWVQSNDNTYEGEFAYESYVEPAGLPGDKGIVMSSEARRHGISAVVSDFSTTDKTFVFQYELQIKKGWECAGAYFKLLTRDDQFKMETFKEATGYTIMFGPDKCGTTNKIHFILRHKNPVSGEWVEHHCASPPQIKGSSSVVDQQTHLYTLVIRPDNSFEIFVDLKSVRKGNLLEDMEPPINPPKEIDDPADSKPSDWVDEEKIKNPEASKPEDWNEDAPREIVDQSAEKPSDWDEDAASMVADPDATKPDDWDEEEDGDWEAPMIDNPECKKHGCGKWVPPMISNPEYKGKWIAPMVDNPDYSGKWAPRQIGNPNFFEDAHPHNIAPIGAIGLELWTMQDGFLFDNVLISQDEPAAKHFAEQTWMKRSAIEDSIEKKAAAEKKKMMLDASYEDSLMGKVKYAWGIFTNFIVENPLLCAGTITLGLIPIVLKFLFGKSNPEPVEAEAPASSSTPAPQVSKDEQPQDKAEPEPPKKETAKKRSTRSKKAD